MNIYNAPPVVLYPVFKIPKKSADLNASDRLIGKHGTPAIPSIQTQAVMYLTPYSLISPVPVGFEFKDSPSVMVYLLDNSFRFFQEAFRYLDSRRLG